MMPITRAQDPCPLTITSEGIRWAGPSDPEPDGPILACELNVPLEARALADLVERAPIPTTLLLELAALCPPGDDEGADPRWRRARAAAALAAGSPAAQISETQGTTIERGVEEVCVLRDGTLARIRDKSLVIGDMPPIALPLGERSMCVIPTPLARDVVDPDEAVVVVYRAESTTLLAFASDGRELARIEAKLPFLPVQISRGKAGYWVSDRYSHHQLFGGDAHAHRVHMHDGAQISARCLLDVDPARRDGELGWVSLDTGERRGFPWASTITTLVRFDDVLWCTTPDGLWCLRGGEAPIRVWSGKADGLAVDATRAWLGIDDERAVVAIELATGRELWRTSISHSLHAMKAFDSVIVVGTWQCTLLAPDGRLLATSEERRDVGAAQLADGTVGVSCGEQIYLVDSTGNVRRAPPMPYDGAIFHATTDRFLFGPVSGGDDHVSPTALVAFDRRGQVTSRCVPPTLPRVVDEKHAYVIAWQQGSELRVWDPRGGTTGIEPPPPRRPTERGQQHIGAEVTNPRDERPEVGIEVHADMLALDGVYWGTPGGEVALRVGDAAIATFVRCDLRTGRDGSIVERGSTVFLIDCMLPPVTWSIGEHCHLVILGGTPSGALRIRAAPTATVTVDGLITRRAGNVWVVTSVPYGTPVVVDGATYHWENDDRSGGYGVNYIHITSADGTAISFELPDGDRKRPGWWHGSGEMTPEVVEHAVRIARRSGATRARELTFDQTQEAFGRAGRTPQDELTDVQTALANLEDRTSSARFVRGMLALGCQDERATIDAWVSTHRDALRAARAGLQRLLDEIDRRAGVWETRSAIAFLVDACARNHVTLALDVTRADRELLRFPREAPLPWGIPASHTWWDVPRPEPEPDVDPKLLV